MKTIAAMTLIFLPGTFICVRGLLLHHDHLYVTFRIHELLTLINRSILVFF